MTAIQAPWKQCPMCNEEMEPGEPGRAQLCQHCGFVCPVVKAGTNPTAVVKVRLSSGQDLEFDKIKLYDLQWAAHLERMRQSAAKNLAGYSSGVGFWGSLEWVAVGSLVAGAIDSTVSSQMASQGNAQLEEMAKASRMIRDTARFISVSTIQNIQYPDPSLWRARVRGGTRYCELIHIATDYVFVQSNEKKTAIFWNKVEQYEFSNEG
jgi:hypothetical protein